MALKIFAKGSENDQLRQRNSTNAANLVQATLRCEFSSRGSHGNRSHTKGFFVNIILTNLFLHISIEYVVHDVGKPSKEDDNVGQWVVSYRNWYTRWLELN